MWLPCHISLAHNFAFLLRDSWQDNDSGFDSGLIFPPFSHYEMQANIKATNNNNWFAATSKSLCTWKMEGANSWVHDAFLCRESFSVLLHGSSSLFRQICALRSRASNRHLTLVNHPVIITVILNALHEPIGKKPVTVQWNFSCFATTQSRMQCLEGGVKNKIATSKICHRFTLTSSIWWGNS